MVMLFPDTADRLWRYGTTNSQYGNFYGTAIRVVQRDDYAHCHDVCNNKAAQLAEDLQEAKACLAKVDYTWARPDQGQYAPRGACCAKERRAPHSRCGCEHRTPGCYENPREKQEVVEWDCGQSREPEFLEDHVRAYHPRLAPKVQVLPRCCTGKTYWSDLRTGSLEARSLGSRGGFGVGLQAALRGSRARKRRSRAASPAQRLKPLPALPASHRYGYYRYYGAAGQGAKTSGDYSGRP